ncbi:MAG: CRISPR-associated endonuclease Cas1, partial [Candidatus Parabeggiatoa sp. nov. 3]
MASWRTLWDNAWGFKERNRRPPRDPVNALLSLGYTLAGNSVGHLASRYGLDLALGFLHIPSRNRPS